MAIKEIKPTQYERDLSAKIQKAIQTQKEWYSLKSLLGFTWCSLFYLIGGREARQVLCRNGFLFT